jgi:hypothetical protein
MSAVLDDIAILEQAKQGGAGSLTYRTDIRVQFYLHASKDELSSRKHGRPIYKDSIYMSTHAAGVKDFMSSPATPEDISNHPAEWKEFTDRMENKRTSVRHLPRLTPAVLLTLEELQIHTIEDFAASTPTPELEEAHAIALRWVGAAQCEAPKRKGGWPKGKPRKGNAEDAQAAA